MAKRLRQQRRGRGTPRYRAKQNGVATIKYCFDYTYDKQRGEIIELLHNPGKSAPLAKIILENKAEFYVPASEGAYVGQVIEVGKGAKLGLNHVLRIGDIPSGFPVFNIENRPGTGGNLLRASGSYGLIINSDEKGVNVKLRSGTKKIFNPNCLCSLGIVAGSGRKEKPFYKAGNKAKAEGAKGGRLYPRVRGAAMNAVDHPHGGSGHNSKGRQKSASKKFGAPGQKVGHFGSKRTGRRKK
jgi:large subunit ribosomal protein L2